MARKHRLGVREVTLVTRKLKLEPSDQQDLQSAIAEIDQLFGLDSVSFDDRKQMLRLAYDALRISIECIEEILTRYSIEISHGWWNRYKRDHYRFVDQNIKDNAAKEPWSCH
ncbi:MAG TPA: cation transporter [Halomonas sp.]|nr:cation transporter [Halomonas sp.]